MSLRRTEPKTSETTARLVLTGDKTKAWLEPISSRPNCDLILEGKGDAGRVYVAEQGVISPVLTAAGLGNIDELAAVLAGITIEGADPAAVAALTQSVEALQNFVTANFNGLFQVLGGNPPSLVGVANWVGKVYDQFEDLETKLGLLRTEFDALVAALAEGTLQVGGGAIDEAAVQALIDASLAGIGPILQQAIQSQIGHLSDKLDLDSTVAADGPFIISTNNLTGAQWKVGIDFRTQREAPITLNGKRVLTEDDALGALTPEQVAALEAVLDEDAVKAIVEAFLTENVGPALHQAIQSAMKAMPDTITLNIKSDNITDKVTIEAHQLTPHAPNDPRSVDVDVKPYGDGKLRVSGKRVLTEEDALNASGIDQAAIDAAIDVATAELRGEIGVLRQELADYKAFVAEQFGNFNTIHETANTEVAQVVLAEQAKLAAYMAALAGKANPTPAEVRRVVDEIAEYVTGVEQQFNQMANDIVEYIISDYVTKVDFAALNTELEGFANEAVPAMVQAELENRIPAILEALQTHLENVLAIFGGGGGTGVTPAQITELTAEFARVYATKDSLAAYAKLDDGNQEINAGLVKARGVQFTISDEVLVPINFNDYGTRLSLIPKNATTVDDAGIVVLHTDIADLGGGK